jgi:hypothetical protein
MKVSETVSFLRKNGFVLSLLVLLVALDALVAWWDPVGRLPYFHKDDFQKVRHFHPEPVYEKVFFGSSSVIAAFDEEISGSGIVNMGLSFGKLTDLEALLQKDLLKISDTLVIGVNFFTMLDKLPTNPHYIWHKQPYEPYLYFYRDEFREYLMEAGEGLLTGAGWPQELEGLYWRERHAGNKPPEELEKAAQRYREQYGDLTMQDFQDNLRALDAILAYGKEHRLKLKVVWMPWNPLNRQPAYVDPLKEAVNQKLEAAGVPYVDWTYRYSPEHFHDLGHMNLDIGAPKFTKEVTAWIESS